jgi:peptidoglycan hydrolase-like protein with peptidoglycan-binding domain
VRDTRPVSAAIAALLTLAALAGCGGHSPSNTAGPGAPSSTAPPAPLHVVSVKPHKLSASDPITVNFDAPVLAQSPLPTLTPNLQGSWSRQGSSAVFTPAQAYPPDTTVTVNFAKKPGGKIKMIATRTTPHGSLLRAEQILAHLHYIPLTNSAPDATSAAEEASDVYDPPAGTFAWRYSDTPSTLKKDWTPGESGEVLRGAVIAFQHDANLPVDGSIGQHTWHALLKADLADTVDPDKYSFVSADLYLPQQLSVWVDGQTVLTSPVNGGVSGAPTPLGTFPVYERLASTTMSGTNPSGSHYSDPGVPWVNYFSGGSAVHGFPRASYGSPQSVGCLELPIPTAAKVFTLIDYGTLVHVAGPFVPSSSGAPAPPSAGTPSSPSPTKSSTPKPSSSPKASATPTAIPTPTPKKSH